MILTQGFLLPGNSSKHAKDLQTALKVGNGWESLRMKAGNSLIDWGKM